MLLYKSWKESQGGFLLSALAIALIAAGLVLFHHDASSGMSDEPLTYPVYVWRAVYKGYLREVFMILTVLLGVGGLTRERDQRTAGFTLALPVSRWRFVAARAMVGFVEMAVLAAIPAIVIPTLSPMFGQAYPTLQAWGFAALWTGGGAFILAMALLASVLFSGEFTAPVVAFLSLIAYSILADLPWIEPVVIEIHDVMSGIDMPYFVEDTGRLIGPLPWATLGTLIVAGSALVAIGGFVTKRQDF